MLHYAILIDGGFAKRKLGNGARPATAQDFQKLIDVLRGLPELREMHLHRVYYYDSVPLEGSHEKPLGGGKIEFSNQPITNRSRQLFEQLWKLPFVALRLAELSWKMRTEKQYKSLTQI